MDFSAFSKFKLDGANLLTVNEAVAFTRVRRVVRRRKPIRRVVIDVDILNGLEQLLCDINRFSDDWILRKTRLSTREKASDVRANIVSKISFIRSQWIKEVSQEAYVSESNETSQETSQECYNESSTEDRPSLACPQMKISFLVS